MILFTTSTPIMVLRSKLVSERTTQFFCPACDRNRANAAARAYKAMHYWGPVKRRPQTFRPYDPLLPLSLSHDPISPLIRTRMSSVYGTDLGRVKWAGHFIVGVDATPPQRKAITNSVAVIPRNRTQLWCGVEKHELIAPFASFHFKTYSRRVYTN